MIRSKFNGYQADASRLYFKGGDGGAGAARQQEEDRQKRIAAAVETINNIFDPKATYKGANPVTAFEGGKTYYDANGKAFKATPVYQSNNKLMPWTTQAPQQNNWFGRQPENREPQWYSFHDVSASPLLGTGSALELGKNSKGGAKESAKLYNMTDINNMLANNQIYSDQEVVQPKNTRHDLYKEQYDAVYGLNKKDLDQQYNQTERDIRFSNARAGQLGGSLDIDSMAALQKRNDEGNMQAVGLADDSVSNLRRADENSKASLVSMAQSGIDTGTAQSMALNNLEANKQSALGGRAASGVNNIFGDLSGANNYYNQQLNNNIAMQQYKNYFGNLAASRGGDNGKVNR